MKTVNQRGMEFIAQKLERHHTHGFVSWQQVSTYARDVEFQVDQGNPPTFEISLLHTESQQPIEITLSDDMLEDIAE